MGHTLKQAVAVLLALAAAIAYPVGTAMQQKANLVQMRRDPEQSAGVATRDVLRQGLWWGGMGLGLFGFALQGVALALGALVLVMPVLVIQLVFMVPAGAWVVNGHMHAHEWAGAVLATVGLAVLLVAIRAESGLARGSTSAWLVAAIVCGAVFVVLWLLALRAGPFRAALLGAAAGVEAGVLSAVLKQATGDLSLLNWALWAIALLGVLNVLVINVAIRAGRLSTAQTLIAVVSTIVSVGLGLTVFQESVMLSFPTLVAGCAGIVLMGAGTWMLSRSPSLLALDAVAAAAEVRASDTSRG